MLRIYEYKIRYSLMINMKLNYQTICADLLKNLPQRTADVIERRFGLKEGSRETLEAVGERYELTRERVRQIEQYGLSEIQKKIKNHQNIFQFLKKTLCFFGGLKEEKSFLEYLGKNEFQNHVYFLLSIGQGFKRISEDEKFYNFWTIKETAIDRAKKLAESTIKRLEKERKLLSLKELLENQCLNKNIFLSFIGLSKEIQKSPEGKYGLRNWLEINPRGVKDKAYLVLKKTKKPLHFSDIASLIGKLPFRSQSPVQIATVHNELIKDQRFVLVGRGLYALKEWGYDSGVVREVIIKTLKESKEPLTKDEIVDKVLKQRFVKANTVLLNLNNKTHFFRNPDGRYQIKEI